MTRTQIAGDARHHRIVELAGANGKGQQQMEQGGQQGLHGGDTRQ